MCLVHYACISKAQQPIIESSSQPQQSTLVGGIDRIAGIDLPSSIQYTRLILNGMARSPIKTVAAQPQPDPPPVFIAQCSLRPDGKYVFEAFTSFGGPLDLKFYPPWKPKDSHDLFAPPTTKVTITMDFIGYTRVKPLRRQWEIPIEPPSLYRYNPPSSKSSNLEEFSYFLRYLLSLPTLRLTLGERATEFQTTPLLAAIRSEPLCRAAGL
jgi:hypothetical protein